MLRAGGSRGIGNLLCRSTVIGKPIFLRSIRYCNFESAISRSVERENTKELLQILEKAKGTKIAAPALGVSLGYLVRVNECDEAEKLFNNLGESYSSLYDVHMATTMINGYCNSEQYDKIDKIVDQVKLLGIIDEFFLVTAIKGYLKAKREHKIQEIVKEYPQLTNNVYYYSIFISDSIHRRHPEKKVYDLYEKMRSKNIKPDARLLNVLIYYGFKTNNYYKVQEFFDEYKKYKYTPSPNTIDAVIKSCSTSLKNQNSYYDQVFDHFEYFKKVNANVEVSIFLYLARNFTKNKAKLAHILNLLELLPHFQIKLSDELLNPIFTSLNSSRQYKYALRFFEVMYKLNFPSSSFVHYYNRVLEHIRDYNLALDIFAHMKKTSTIPNISTMDYLIRLATKNDDKVRLEKFKLSKSKLDNEPQLIGYQDGKSFENNVNDNNGGDKIINMKNLNNNIEFKNYLEELLKNQANLDLNQITSIFSELFVSNQFYKGIYLFNHIDQLKIQPDNVLYSIIIKACLQRNYLIDSLQYLNEMAKKQIFIKESIVIALFTYLSQIKKYEIISKILADKNYLLALPVETAHKIISSLCDLSLYSHIIPFLNILVQNKMDPDDKIFIKIVYSLSHADKFDLISTFLHWIKKSQIRLEGEFFRTTIKIICEFDKKELVLQIFKFMKKNNYPFDYAMLNNLLKIPSLNSTLSTTLNIVNKMQLEYNVTPNIGTFNIILQRHVMQCTSMAEMQSAFELFKNLKRKYPVTPDVATYNVIINGFIKFNDCDQANFLFNEMINNNIQPNHGSFIHFIRFYCERNEFDQAIRLYYIMCDKYKIISSWEINNLLVKTLCETGDINLIFAAVDILNKITEGDGERDSVLYHFVIDTLLSKNLYSKAFDILISTHKKGIKFTDHTISIWLQEFGKHNRTDLAVQVFNDLPTKYDVPFNVPNFNVVLDTVIANHGTKAAVEFFEAAFTRYFIQPDTISYTTVIRGFLIESDTENAIKTFERMNSNRIAPDKTTFKTLFEGFIISNYTEGIIQFWPKMIARNIQVGRSTFIKIISALSAASADNPDAKNLFIEITDSIASYGFSHRDLLTVQETKEKLILEMVKKGHLKNYKLEPLEME